MRLHKLFEGYKILPSIDRERYQERDGLEGPFRAANGKVYYYDAKEGKPYDPDTDMYIDYDDFEQMDKDRDFNEASEHPGWKANSKMPKAKAGRTKHPAKGLVGESDESGASAGPDYEDPEGRFVIVSDGNKYFALGIGQYGDALPLTDRGFKSVDDAVEDAEEILGEALGESPAWDSHNTDVRAERGRGKVHDSTSFIVRNKAKKKRSKTKFPSWKDAMAFAAKFGGVKAGWEVVSEATGKVVTEGRDDEMFIEVSVRDARRALEILDDQYRDQFDHNGSNYYVFDDADVAYAVWDTFHDQGIEILDANVEVDDAPSWDRSSGEDDFDESVNEVSKSMLNRYKRAARDDERRAGEQDMTWAYQNDFTGKTDHMDDWSDEDRESTIAGRRRAKKRRKGLAVAQAKTAKNGKNLGSGKMRGYSAKVRATDESLGESDDGPFYALVIFGPESKKKKIKFKNQAQFEKWSDKHDGNYELLSFQDIDESINEVSHSKLFKAAGKAGAEADKYATVTDRKGLEKAIKRSKQQTKFFKRASDKLRNAGLESGEMSLVGEGERHGNDKMYDKCWDGYKKVPGKKRGEKGSCVKINEHVNTINGDEITITNAEDIRGMLDESIMEAEYQGRKVTLNKPMQGDVKKFKVYVKNEQGNVVKVNFGDPDMRIKKSNPERRKSFRARHNCDNPGPKTKARYWSCRKW